MADVPSTMRAVLLTGHGGPEMLEYREDWPVPVPAADEVLVRVTACGVNNTDIWVREGAYGTDEDPDAVSSWRRGVPDRVPADPGRGHRRTHCRRSARGSTGESSASG